METAFSYGILANAFGDLVLSTGIAQQFVENGAFGEFASPHKSIVASAFTSSFLIHGLVRLFGGANLKDKNLRLLTVLSYLGEVYQAAQLISAGALTGTDGYVYVTVPWVPIIYLLFVYKDKKE